MSLWSDLGDSKEIVSILMRNTDLCTALSVRHIHGDSRAGADLPEKSDLR